MVYFNCFFVLVVCLGCVLVCKEKLISDHCEELYDQIDKRKPCLNKIK